MNSAFIRVHIEELLRKFLSQVPIKLIQPYTRLGILHATKSLRLNTDEREVEDLLTGLIVDEKIDAN
jgi:PCI domain